MNEVKRMKNAHDLVYIGDELERKRKKTYRRHVKPSEKEKYNAGDKLRFE